MQYTHRKLQRSVTLTRRSRIGRPRVSRRVSGAAMWSADRGSPGRGAQRGTAPRRLPPGMRPTRRHLLWLIPLAAAAALIALLLIRPPVAAPGPAGESAPSAARWDPIPVVDPDP